MEPSQREGTGARPHGPANGPALSTLKRWGPAILILAFMVLAYAAGWHRTFSLSTLIQHRMTLSGLVAGHAMLAAALYCLAYVAMIVLSIPGGAIATIAGGFLFGWALGTFLTVVAATAGATLLFLVARSAFGQGLIARAGPRLKRAAEGFRRDSFNYLLFLRLVPLFPFWLVNLAPALVGMRVAPYVAATAIGIVPGTFAFAFIGTGLDSLIMAQEAVDPGCAEAGRCSLDPGALLTPEIIIAFVALGLLSLVPVAYRAWRAGRGSGGGAPS